MSGLSDCTVSGRLSRSDYAVLALAVLAVSTSAPLIRLSQAEPLTIAFWRVFLAAVGTWLIAMTRARWRVAPATWGLTWLAGLFLGLHCWVWITSLQYTSVANSVLLVTTQPIWAALIGRVFLRERVPAIAVFGIVLTLAGSAVAIGTSGVQLQGDLLALAGGVLAAAYMVVGRRERQGWDTVPYLARVYLTAAILLALGIVATGQTFIPPRTEDWWVFVALAVIPTGIGHSLYNYVLRHLPAYVVATTITGEPIGASILAYVVLGESPPTRALIAAPFILGGIILVGLSQRRRIPTP
jgi:drug/metabolite transporter (DMT)-like permease